MTTTDFGASAARGAIPAGFDCGSSRVRPLPPLTDEQIAKLERAMTASGLPSRPRDDWGTARMLGLTALTGLGMVAGSVCALWLLITPL